MESKNLKRTLRYIKMVMAEKNNRELLWTEKRIAYNNTWPKEGKWYSDVQQMLDEWLKEQGITQIFEPVKLSEGAKDILFPNAKLNKIFSGIVDIYDELPYRPDEGFDIAWRSLEIFMNHHRSIAWPKDNDKATHLMLRTVKELIMPLVNRDLRVKEMWERFLSEIPISVLRFAVMRCFIQHDLAITDKAEKVSERAKDILTKELYADIKAKYELEETVKPSADVLRRSSLLLQKILRGEKVTVNNNEYLVDIEKRILFMLSCVLYTYRCERFHGDYFSPFKSDMATLNTYAFSYYLLIFSYVYLWILIYQFCEWQNLGEICLLANILAAAKTMQDRMKSMI